MTYLLPTLVGGAGPSPRRVAGGGLGQVQGSTLQTEPFVWGPTHPHQAFRPGPSPLPQPLKGGLFSEPALGDPHLAASLRCVRGVSSATNVLPSPIHTALRLGPALRQALGKRPTLSLTLSLRSWMLDK